MNGNLKENIIKVKGRQTNNFVCCDSWKNISTIENKKRVSCGDGVAVAFSMIVII